ncbi:MAG: HAMP domain-containing sensor histidine kinase [Marinoscillum sp.]
MFDKIRFQKDFLANRVVSSEIERSRILFSARTIVVIILASLFFLMYDIFLGYTSSLWVYTPFIVIFGIALYLLRIGKHDFGRSVLLVALNLFVYIVMSSIPEDSMSAIFYLSIIVVEYILLGHDRKFRLFALLGLSFTLYTLDTFVDFSLLPIRAYDETTLKVNKIIDFVICVIGLLMTLRLLIGYLQDIIAERTRNNEELQRLNNELDKYAYTITHDLKGPIHSMLRLIHLPTIDRSNIDEYLTTIRGSFQNLWGLIEGATEQARNRNFEVIREEFNLYKTVAISWELIRHAPEAQGIDLILDVPKAIKVETDKRRIIGILNNLITNAIRYHDKSKNNRYIKVSGYIIDQWIHLSIEDNGLGIEPEHQEKVFEMFYRASNLLGGSGLGLFTVKESVDKLSGQITLESTLGKGTTFKIKIPPIEVEE